MFGSLIDFELIFVYSIRVQNNFLACVYAVFSAPSVKKTVQFLLCELDSLSKDHLPVSFQALFSIPFIYMSVFMPIPYCFVYLGVKYILKSRSVMQPLIYSFLIVLAIWVSSDS